jgi:hypothetical protein
LHSAEAIVSVLRGGVMEAASPRLSMSFQGMGNLLTRCGQKQKQKKMRGKPTGIAVN